jgi:L-threonylcarbamoyladenylate synthase
MRNIYKNSKYNLNKAKKILIKNKIIAVPTETVYGLAGNAYSNKSVKKIYNLKKRPKNNPLIIHYYNLNMLKKDAFLDNNFLKLYKKFSPGPLTFILRKKEKSKISKFANANLNTIAVRFPNNKVIRSLLKKLNFPLAVPSANISTGVSPTEPSDVIDEFKNKIKFILDGGKSRIGLESTVVNLCGQINILRPGSINNAEITKVVGKKVFNIVKLKKIISPGLLKRHYSPGIPIKLNVKRSDDKAAFIVFGKRYKMKKNMFNLSPKNNLNEAAKNLYKILRKIKKLKYKKINVVKIPNKRIGIAINDRLRKAAY